MYIKVELEGYELEALIEYHKGQQYECAAAEDYVQAEDHKQRQAKLRALKGKQ